MERELSARSRHVLVDVELEPSRTPAPPAVAAFLKDAESRIDAFFEARWREPVVGFVPSQFAQIWPALAAITQRRLARGTLFCEWGAGFGVVAGLAAALRWRAHAIEIEPVLVDAARALLAAHHLDVKLVCGSFVPRGGEALAKTKGEMAWLLTGGADGHALLGLQPRELDLVFAYPWPGEEHVIEEIFARYADEGALLLTFRGEERVKLQRRTRGRAPRLAPGVARG